MHDTRNTTRPSTRALVRQPQGNTRPQPNPPTSTTSRTTGNQPSRDPTTRENHDARAPSHSWGGRATPGTPIAVPDGEGASDTPGVSRLSRGSSQIRWVCTGSPPLRVQCPRNRSPYALGSRIAPPPPPGKRRLPAIGAPYLGGWLRQRRSAEGLRVSIPPL